MSNPNFVDSLSDPAGWLTGLISNFVVHGFDPQTCTIRHGTTGTGAFPNYKIEAPSYKVTIEADSLPLQFDVTPGLTFNGRHHGEMTELYDLERHDEHWSPVMTFSDAQILRDRPIRPKHVGGERHAFS